MSSSPLALVHALALLMVLASSGDFHKLPSTEQRRYRDILRRKCGKGN